VLSGEQMRKVLAEAARRFDFVIIDTPPVALLPDAHLLSKITDMVLLVVESGRSPLPALKRAIEAVGRERILGVVLNRAERGLTVGTYRYYSDYQPYSADRRVLAK
jgi:Mrp family chromosome partitioning ATPase